MGVACGSVVRSDAARHCADRSLGAHGERPPGSQAVLALHQQTASICARDGRASRCSGAPGWRIEQSDFGSLALIAVGIPVGATFASLSAPATAVGSHQRGPAVAGARHLPAISARVSTTGGIVMRCQPLARRSCGHAAVKSSMGRCQAEAAGVSRSRYACVCCAEAPWVPSPCRVAVVALACPISLPHPTSPAQGTNRLSGTPAPRRLVGLIPCRRGRGRWRVWARTERTTAPTPSKRRKHQ